MIKTAAQAKKKFNADYATEAIRWVQKRTNGEWRVNPYNDQKFEWVTPDGVVLAQVYAWGEVAKSGEFEKLLREWAKEYPYFAMTRSYRANGDCVKGRRWFRSDAERAAWMRRTPLAVTFFN